MSWLDDAGSWIGDNAGRLIDPLGLTPVGQGTLFDPRTEGQYAGVDRNNFNLPGADQRGESNRDMGFRAGLSSTGWEQQQNQVANRLSRQMNGQDSLSAQQLRGAADSNIANQRSMAASAPPGNAALMNLQAMQGAGKINQGYAGQAAQAGIQERNAAAQSLGQLAGGARQQSIGQQDSAYGRELANAQMQQQGGMAYEGNRTARSGAAMAAPTPGEQFLGAAAGVGEAYLKSDERSKTGITNGSVDVRAFLDRVSPASYSYKEPGQYAPPGRHTGVMAQDLERSPAGRGAVRDTPDGKMVDYGQLSGTMLASLADLHDRLKKVEGPGDDAGAVFGARTKQTARRPVRT